MVTGITRKGKADIAVIDSTSELFSPSEISRMIWALWYQANFHYNRSPWVEKQYTVPIGHVYLAADVQIVPDGVWIMELLDHSDQMGALGYHEDKSWVSKQGLTGTHSERGIVANTQVPLMKVFCATALEDSVLPSTVASHELLEAAVNPYVMDDSNIMKELDLVSNMFYVDEIADPVEGESYDVGAPEGRPCNDNFAMVSNFVWPRWFKKAQTREEFDFLDHLKNSFELAPGGYISRAPAESPDAWTAIYGMKSTHALAPRDPDDPHGS